MARGGEGQELEPYLQCAPYARQVTGIELFGEASTWWEQAQGRYATGHKPRVGAVMTFRPYRNMQSGHVAAVSKVIDSRRVLLDHANWSPVNGRRGQVEKDVLAVDVSPTNDWSQVQVWYAPLGKVGSTAWPVDGFIYTDRAVQKQAPLAQGPRTPVQTVPAREEPSTRFLSAFAKFQ
ncbi:CHAP domain-containing protein [Erythrobacter mangrovi]|uniref:CHAP domain-containing protein n=2 Tax=Erythrobacter mangrovi TaxID=2739433 RepID=A0A7D4C704_9SPHN|nr:CHAP domain-containing protein [Erythrobacter mangrovi]QKG72785.1 CHAP domain-containing protein [Erythrobacter mangrovi]